jgi:signal transduction histidine kinase
MITHMPEPNATAERVTHQPGKIKPVYLLPQGQIQGQASDELAELLSHQILSSAAKVEAIAYILGELSVSSKPIPPEVLSTLHSVTRQLRYLGQSALYLGSTTHLAAQPNYKPVNMAMLMTEAIETFRVQALGRLIKVYPANLPEVRGDADQLRVVLDNLINNALKYSAPQSPIFFSAERCQGLTRKDNGHLLISVTNYGSYIPAEEQDKIFTKFYRSEEHQQSGQGLGLPLSRRLIELHGGNLRWKVQLRMGPPFGLQSHCPKSVKKAEG